eukprot:202718-Chlamydomonas_euryale.AAC.5
MCSVSCNSAVRLVDMSGPLSWSRGRLPSLAGSGRHPCQSVASWRSSEAAWAAASERAAAADSRWLRTPGVFSLLEVSGVERSALPSTTDALHLRLCTYTCARSSTYTRKHITRSDHASRSMDSHTWTYTLHEALVMVSNVHQSYIHSRSMRLSHTDNLISTTNIYAA